MCRAACSDVVGWQCISFSGVGVWRACVVLINMSYVLSCFWSEWLLITMTCCGVVMLRSSTVQKSPIPSLISNSQSIAIMESLLLLQSMPPTTANIQTQTQRSGGGGGGRKLPHITGKLHYFKSIPSLIRSLVSSLIRIRSPNKSIPSLPHVIRIRGPNTVT